MQPCRNSRTTSAITGQSSAHKRNSAAASRTKENADFELRSGSCLSQNPPASAGRKHRSPPPPKCKQVPAEWPVCIAPLTGWAPKVAPQVHSATVKFKLPEATTNGRFAHYNLAHAPGPHETRAVYARAAFAEHQRRPGQHPLRCLSQPKVYRIRRASICSTAFAPSPA